MDMAMADALVDQVATYRRVKAVELTGTHPGRFVDRADVRWMQEAGTTISPIGPGIASAVVYTAAAVRHMPLIVAMQLDKLHATFLRMYSCGVIFTRP